MNTLKKLTEHDGIKLTETITTIRVDATPEKVWQALLRFGDVSSFHSGVARSVPGGGSSPVASMGAERTCTVMDGRREITLVERITEFEAGSFYRYQVYEWRNFPLKVMFFGFAIGQDASGATTLSLTQNYRLKPGFLTRLMGWKIRKQQREILLGYKHYIETGESNVPLATISRIDSHRLAFC